MRGFFSNHQVIRLVQNLYPYKIFKDIISLVLKVLTAILDIKVFASL